MSVSMIHAVGMYGAVIRTDGELNIVGDVPEYVKICDDFREMFIPMRYVKFVERDGVLIYGSYGRRGKVLSKDEERIISEIIDRHKKTLDMLAEDD